MKVNHFNLASTLSRVSLETKELELCNVALLELKTLDLQESFYLYCKKWKLSPWIYTQMNTYDLVDKLHPDVISRFQSDHIAVQKQNELRNKNAAIFLKEFVKEGIDVIVLKGNYLAHTSYNDTGYKRMNDFDILIRMEDWDRIQDVYLRLGYIPLGFGWSGEKEKPASFSHVGMSFISSDFSCIIGSQWGLKSPTTSFSVNIQEAWNTSVPFNFLGVPVKALNTEFNLLHLILHLGIYKCGIRDCMDIYNLVRSKSLDEVKLQHILRESKAESKAYFALQMSNLCSPEFSSELMNSLRPSLNGFVKTRLKRRMEVVESTGDLQTSYNDYFQDVEKVVIYFNLFPKFHVKFALYLRILRMIYFPKTTFALRLNDRSHKPSLWNKVIAHIKAPYLVFSLIAQEIGWKFTVLLFMKLGIDLLISLKNYFVGKDSYFDYLQQKGIDPKEIEKAVKNIQ